MDDDGEYTVDSSPTSVLCEKLGESGPVIVVVNEIARSSSASQLEIFN